MANDGDGGAIPGDHMKAGFGVPPEARTLVLEAPLRLECGDELARCTLAYTCYGELNAAGDNAAIVGHSLTSNSNVHEWWAEMIGEGERYALDTTKLFVVCVNYLGSPYGSTSPVTPMPAGAGDADGDDKAAVTEQARYGADFPAPVTMRDNVAAQYALLRELGVTRLRCVLGGSMGSMLALEWAACHPDFVGSVVMIAGCGRHTDWQIGISEAHRQAIYADHKWKGGRYGDDAPPNAGLATARMMAMLQYRAPASVAEKFNRGLQQVPSQGGSNGGEGGGGSAHPPADAGSKTFRVGSGVSSASSTSNLPFFQVQSYLYHQGSKFIDRFDANCYVALTHTLDSHDVSRGRGEYADVLRSLPHRALVVGIDSDVLYPLELQAEVASHMPNARLHTIRSPHGHDAFLIEIEDLNTVVANFLKGEDVVGEGSDDLYQRKGSVESLAHRVWELERQLAAALEVADAERATATGLREQLQSVGGESGAEMEETRARAAWGMVERLRLHAAESPSERLQAISRGGFAPVFGKLAGRDARGAGAF